MLRRPRLHLDAEPGPCVSERFRSDTRLPGEGLHLLRRPWPIRELGGLDHHDSRLVRCGLDQERRLRLGALALGARLRPLGGLAGRPRRGWHRNKNEERRAAQDIPEKIVEHLVTETALSREPESA